MKILLITHTFMPDLNPRALRWAAICTELAHRGHEVHVLCATPSEQAAADGIHIHRVADPIYGRLHRYKGSPQTHTPDSSPVSLWGMFRSRMIQAGKWLWNRLHWPDYAMGWVGPATASVKALCEQHAFDWMISSSNPFSGHVVALRSRRHIAPTKWLIDLGDPYSQMEATSPYNRWLYQRRSLRTERQVLHGADRVSVTTKQTAEEFDKLHPGIARKISVIPPLLSIPALPAASQVSGRMIRVVYIGTLYRAIRNPAPAFQCLAAWLRQHPDMALELHFYGSIGDCEAEFKNLPEELNDKVVLHGPVSRAQVMQAMVDSSILLNIGNTTETQLPSKLVEYMATGKPILHLTQAKVDAAQDLLSRYPAALSVRVSDGGLSESALNQLTELMCSPPLISASDVQDLLHPFSVTSITDQYLACLTQ